MRACCRLISWIFVHTVFFILFIAFMPGLPPEDQIQFEELSPSSPREGPYAPNNILDGAERLFENVIVAPESVAYRGKPNEVFVSMHGGSIVRLSGPSYKHMKEVAKIGPGCKGFWEEKVCGRPLGLRFSRDGKLLVADAYFGIFKVDVDTGDKEQLVDAQTPINGKRPMLIDDLDEDSEGNIYWSDASTIAHLDVATLELFAGPTGRLIKRDASTGHNFVLLDKVFFANGVQLSPQEDFVLVAETPMSRVKRYWLKGEKAGSHDIFVDRLPGYPDNIRPRPEGGYYVPLVAMKAPQKPDITATALRLPWLRRVLARIGYGTVKVLDALAQLLGNDDLARASYNVMNLMTSAQLMAKEGSMVVAVDAEGNVEYTLQSPAGVVGYISHTTQTNDKLVFGSTFNKFLAIISLNKIKPGSAHEPRTIEAEINLGDARIKEEL